MRKKDRTLTTIGVIVNKSTSIVGATAVDSARESGLGTASLAECVVTPESSTACSRTTECSTATPSLVYKGNSKL